MQLTTYALLSQRAFSIVMQRWTNRRLRSKVAAGSTFPQRIVQSADAATFSYKQDGHWLTHAEAVAFSPSCLCTFFITTAGNTEMRPACRYTRYSRPVLCLYNTFAVTRRRGLNGSLGKKNPKDLLCAKTPPDSRKAAEKCMMRGELAELTLPWLVA